MPKRHSLRSLSLAVLFALAVMIAPLTFAQQTGSISGTVTSSDGGGLPGVTVEATSNVLPQPRVTTTGLNGEYRLPALPPGMYTVQFSLSGLATQARTVRVNLGQDTAANVALGMDALAETITVSAEATLVDTTSTELKSSLNSEALDQLPIGQEYRDLLKLAPAVQYTENTVRGPSAGGSEQDNVYQFDGVNVTLPLFGTLAAEPSTHDIEAITIVKGGAKAIDFNRAAGFLIDSVSKSGTNEWTGEVKYQYRDGDWVGDRDGATGSTFDEDRAWATLGIGGPLVRDQLFFYGSYYRPTIERANSANVYGEVPDFDSTRDELFGKLTWTPTSNILLHGSYRDSDRTNENASIGGTETASAALNEETDQAIAIFEGSWVINERSFATGKFTDYALETGSIPATILDVVPSGALGTQLDLNNLDQFGRFVVPSLGSNAEFNAFAAPLIERYGFIRDGVRTGGGVVGAGSQFNLQDFYRQSAQLGYDYSLGQNVTHNLHVGYQWYVDEEDLIRSSNGFGLITVPAGFGTCPTGTQCAGQRFAFQSDFQRSNIGTGTQVIHSEFESHNIELNDTIQWGDWAFNVGVMLSNDILYGQGLREADNIAGYVTEAGNKYKMYEIDFDEQIQPRLGVTWAYNSSDTVYASYSRYNPSANSLPRAASWDRNTLGLVTRVFFNEQGVAIGSQQVASSSGKLFADDLDPRYTDEYILGTARQFGSRLSTRLYARHRYSTNFWEDTNNNARTSPAFAAPPEIAALGDYIPNLSTLLDAIGIPRGSTYVIAELDGAFTKYYEATVEADYRATNNLMFRSTYTWSHYYGNFDQDSTSTTYDFATFIGSSNLSDGPGRQVWDRKYGDLHGDRRHLFKINGSYNLPWNSTIGAFALYQSGHAWEAWDHRPYLRPGNTSTSDVNRYAEPAGSRTTDDHYQVDLNYTQNIPLGGFTAQIIGEVFNLFDKQTGYAPNPVLNSSLFGTPRIQYAPRRFQLAVRLLF